MNNETMSEFSSGGQAYTIKSFRNIASYTLEIVFGNNVCKAINFLPVLNGDMYGLLKDEEYFDKVRLDPEVKTK